MKRAIFLLLAVTLSSCTRLDWAVRFADTYVMMEADHFFDLTGDQKKASRPEVKKALNSIRTDVFPRAADFLETIDTELKKGAPTAETLEAWFRRGEELVRASMVKFDDAALQLAKTASPEQDAHFQKEFKDALDELRDKTSTPERAFKNDSKKASKWLDYLGLELNRDQRRDLDAFLHEHPTPYALQIESREKMLKDFLVTSGEARLEWIRRFHEKPETFRSPEYRAALAAHELDLRKFLSRMFTTLDERQRKSMSDSLRDRAGDFRRLAKVE